MKAASLQTCPATLLGSGIGPRDPRSLVSNYLALDGPPAIDFPELCRRAPLLAGDLAYRVFCVPRFSEYRSANHQMLVGRARHHLRGAIRHTLDTRVGKVSVYEMMPDGEPRGHIMVIHGWTSEASFMMGLAEPLRRSGFRVVLADCPAHGRSAGEHTTLISCAQAMVDVAVRFGPFDGALAHSMGALATLMAGVGDAPMPHPVLFKRYCLIAAPNRFKEVTSRFSQRLGLSYGAQRQFEKQLERIAYMPIEDFSTDRFLSVVRQPTLVIHAKDDREVPFHNAEEIAAVGGHITLLPFQGLGHRKILYAPPVVRSVVAFFRALDES